MTEVKGTIFFMDGTKMTLSWPRHAGNDPATVASTIKNALDSDKLLAEVDGQLLVIPMRNIKYFQVTPAPEKIPAGTLLGAQVID